MWSDKSIKKLTSLWLNNVDSKEIANELNTTVNAIHKLIGKLRREGIPLPMRKGGYETTRGKKLWTQEEVEYLVRRRNDKISAEKISEELGRTVYSINAMIYSLRTEDVDVCMLGQGKRRLWSSEKLKMAIIGRGLRDE